MESFDPSALITAIESDSLGAALFELSAVLTSRPDALEVGTGMLDDLAARVDSPTNEGIIAALFGPDGFSGDVLDYHAEANSMLDQVLQRRLGMPITLSAVVVEVGKRVGLDFQMMAMPGHVVVGTGEPHRYIDAFGGVEVDGDGLRRRFESIFGEGASFDASGGVQPLGVAGVVNRVGNNLLRTWANGQDAKLDRLLDLRAVIPASEGDWKLVIGVAEASGRFDIAAKLRERIDPDDPQIGQLWAKLN